jgi:hypothetical protein
MPVWKSPLCLKIYLGSLVLGKIKPLENKGSCQDNGFVK